VTGREGERENTRGKGTVGGKGRGEGKRTREWKTGENIDERGEGCLLLNGGLVTPLFGDGRPCTAVC